MRIALLIALFAALASVRAQEPSAPSPPPVRNVPIRFAPPPMEGTISLGIYDGAGKLVRVLHRENTIADFTAGHDALETSWDGKDDAGHPLPAGKYSARGYLVANLKIDGVGYFFNDWVSDETSPHIRQLWQLWMENDELRFEADLADGRKAGFICAQATGAISREIPPHWELHCDEVPKLPNVISPLDCATGKDATRWFIDSNGGNEPFEVKQLSKNNELLRRLVCTKDDPQPQNIEASTKEDRIFLLEQNAGMQRFRALTLVRTTADAAAGSISDWKTDFEKKIVAHKNFSIEDGKPVITPNEQISPGRISQRLQPNPLKHDQAEKVDLAVGIDSDGSYLQTSDGLPLRTISDTPNLERALLAAQGDKAADVFQDDGAVVEQFRISGLDQMMSFDCGDFDLQRSALSNRPNESPPQSAGSD